MLNVICYFYLASVSQKPPISGIVKVKNFKKKFNIAAMPSYFYDGTIHYCICFLIFFILSLSSVRLLNSLSLSLSLSKLLSTLTLSRFVLVVGPPRQCVGRGLVDWWIGEFRVLGFVGFFFFFWWPVLKGISVWVRCCWVLLVVEDRRRVRFCWVFVGHLWVLFWQWWVVGDG